MANEIRQTINLSATKGGATVTMAGNKQIDMAGANMTQATQSIGTTAETLALGDISGAPSCIAIKNLDTVNFIEIGGDSGLTVFKLKIRAGHSALFEPTSGTIYAKADTAAVRVQLVAMEA